MTVKQLIEKLQTMPQNHLVLVDRYSDYATVEVVKLMSVIPQQQGEYYLDVDRRETPPLNAHGAVYLSRD